MEKPWLQHYEAGVPHQLTYPDVPLDTILRRVARRYPEQTATRLVLRYLLGGRWTVGGTLSYQELDDLVDRFATALYQLGVRKGQRVAVMLPNSPHFLIAFFASMRLGAIVVNINPIYTARELLEQLEDSAAETLVLLNMFWPRLREIQSSTQLKRVVVAHITDTLPLASRLLVQASQRRTGEHVRVRAEHNIFFFDRLLKKYGPNPPRVDVDVDDVALFQYTGGTTGTPKGAMLTHRNMMANVSQMTAWVKGVRPRGEKMMGAIPFFHAYGLSTCLLYGINIASELVIVPNPRPIDNVMNIIARERCTLFPGVPAMYMGIVNHPDARHYNMQSVRICISGAAPLPAELQKRFNELTGARLVEGYGLSEASPVTHCNPLASEERPGSMGVPFPDVEARLVDMQSGEDVPFDGESTGELWVRGPQVMKGYWNRPEETRASLNTEGWLHTGDVCRADPDGFFYVVDRRKDVINVSGYQVLPREVEEVLFMHAEVQDVVVAGIPRPERGDDLVKAYVVLQPGAQVGQEDLREFCRLHLAPYKVPREVAFRRDIPRTIVGKALRRKLIEEEQQQQEDTPQADQPQEQSTAAGT
jgi:long-chain acyl-CoA synthetase